MFSSIMNRCSIALLATIAISLAGCGGGGSADTRNVSGTVTYKGNPVANVGITFNSQAGGRGAVGQTDANGKFASLSTGSGGADGVTPGEYIVTLAPVDPTAAEMGDEDESAAGDESFGGDATDFGDEIAPGEETPEGAGGGSFPDKYLSISSSDLKVTVKDSGNENLELKLTD